jgi:hypothetical protein
MEKPKATERLGHCMTGKRELDGRGLLKRFKSRLWPSVGELFAAITVIAHDRNSEHGYLVV